MCNCPFSNLLSGLRNLFGPPCGCNTCGCNGAGNGTNGINYNGGIGPVRLPGNTGYDDYYARQYALWPYSSTCGC